MTITELQKILADELAAHGDVEVMVNIATFPEDENGTIFDVQSAVVDKVQGADDSGPVGDKYPMLIITGVVDWHTHGNPFK